MADISTKSPIDNRKVFVALAQARALMWQAGELELHAAVDFLQRWAERTGLVAEISQDEVQRLMSDAFRGVRDD